MTTYSELARESIHHVADGLRKQMLGGFLLGEPMDIDDLDMVIVFAYALGKQEEGKARAKEAFHMIDLLGGK